MTRINLVDPALLSDKHLGAEYRELPRVFALVRAAAERGEKPGDGSPERFTLGTGHVRFFYPRLGFLVQRHALLVQECARRGRKVSYPAPPLAGIPGEWFGGYEPTDADMRLSLNRIEERGGLRRTEQPAN